MTSHERATEQPTKPDSPASQQVIGHYRGTGFARWYPAVFAVLWLILGISQYVRRGQQAHMLDPMLPVIVPAGSALADALSALTTAAAASVRRLGPTAPPWQIIAIIARGQLLAPIRGG